MTPWGEHYAIRALQGQEGCPGLSEPEGARAVSGRGGFGRGLKHLSLLCLLSHRKGKGILALCFRAF